MPLASLVAVQIRLHLVLDLGRILAAVDHLAAQLHAEGGGIALAALDGRGIGDVVVDAQKLLDARFLGLLAGAEPGVVFRLPDVQQGAKLFRLLLGSRIDGDDRDALVDRIRDRSLEHVEVGDGDDDAVRVGRRRLLDDAGHVSEIAGGRIAVVDPHVHLLARHLDGVLDRVPPTVTVRCVADQDELFTCCRGEIRSPRQTNRRQSGDRQCKKPRCHGFLPSFPMRPNRRAAMV